MTSFAILIVDACLSFSQIVWAGQGTAGMCRFLRTLTATSVSMKSVCEMQVRLGDDVYVSHEDSKEGVAPMRVYEMFEDIAVRAGMV